jgi:hypothetical protein
VGSDVTGDEANTMLVDPYVQDRRGQRDMGRFGNGPCNLWYLDTCWTLSYEDGLEFFESQKNELRHIPLDFNKHNG